MLFVLLFSCLLSNGCAPQPPDVFVFQQLSQRWAMNPETGHLVLDPNPICIEKINEPECGHGVSIVRGREVFVGFNKENWFEGKTWDELRAESVLVPAKESYAPLETYIINSCKKMGCSSQINTLKLKLGMRI